MSHVHKLTVNCTNLSSLSERLSARSKEGALYTSANSSFFLKPFLSSGVVHLHKKNKQKKAPPARKHKLFGHLQKKTVGPQTEYKLCKNWLGNPLKYIGGGEHLTKQCAYDNPWILNIRFFMEDK